MRRGVRTRELDGQLSIKTFRSPVGGNAEDPGYRQDCNIIHYLVQGGGGGLEEPTVPREIKFLLGLVGKC